MEKRFKFQNTKTGTVIIRKGISPAWAREKCPKGSWKFIGVA